MTSTLTTADGVVTSLLPVLYFADIFLYRSQHRTGIDPPIPWGILQTLDLLWMICLSFSTRMAVPEAPIRVTRQILRFEEEFEANEVEHKLFIRHTSRRRFGKLRGIVPIDVVVDEVYGAGRAAVGVVDDVYDAGRAAAGRAARVVGVA